jgi:hypothetical protein
MSRGRPGTYIYQHLSPHYLQWSPPLLLPGRGCACFDIRLDDRCLPDIEQRPVILSGDRGNLCRVSIAPRVDSITLPFGYSLVATEYTVCRLMRGSCTRRWPISTHVYKVGRLYQSTPATLRDRP